MTISEFQNIKDTVKLVLKELNEKLIQMKSLGLEPVELSDACIEMAGYSFAIDTWEQTDFSSENVTNYISEGHVKAIYSRALILRNIK